MSRHGWQGDPTVLPLVNSVRRLAPGAHVVRVYPDGSVNAYRADRTRIPGRDLAHDRRVAELLRRHFQRVNWQVGHDFYVASGELRAAPRPGQRGSQPAADRTFGSGFAPLYLPADPIPRAVEFS